MLFKWFAEFVDDESLAVEAVIKELGIMEVLNDVDLLADDYTNLEEDHTNANQAEDHTNLMVDHSYIIVGEGLDD